MTWAEYYERYDGWQESTQYSRLASIKDFGPDGSPSERRRVVFFPVKGCKAKSRKALILLTFL